MRKSPRLSYVPSRLSMVPDLFATRLPPDVVVLHTTPPRDGKVSLGVEVNVLPAAIEAARRHGGAGRSPRPTAEMPWTFGDAVLDLDHGRRAGRGRRADAPRAGQHRRRGLRDDRRASSPSGSATARPCRRASARCPTPPCTGWPAGAGCGCGPRCSPTACWRSSGPAPSTARSPLTASFLFGSPELLEWVDGNDAGRDAAHRGHQQPGPDRPQPRDDQRQHRAAGRPVRAGQRQPDQRPHPLRLRRPDRLHRRSDAQPRAARRSSRCARGTPRPTARRSCRWSTSRSRRSR